ncbi:MAG: hypothetical protein WCW01_03055 [Gammaproteobacteria bacterium]|jgi:hypothetical protein
MRNFKNFLKFIGIGILCILLSACFSGNKYAHIEKKQYLFSFSVPHAKMSQAKTGAPFLNILPVMTVAAFDQNYFLYRVSSGQYLVDYYHGFLVSPASQLDAVLPSYIKKTGTFRPAPSEALGETAFALQTKIIELYADYRDRNHPKAVATLQFVLTTRDKGKTVVLLDQTWHSNIALKAKNAGSLINAWNNGIESDILMFLLKLKALGVSRSR